MATEAFAGPVDYLVFGFDAAADVWPGLRAVLDRVDDGIVEVLDIEIIARGEGGEAVSRSVADLPGATADEVRLFDGARSGILDDEDLAAVAAALAPDAVAVAVVYEDRSLAVAAAAWSSVGGTELFSGGVDLADLERILDEEVPA
ncbi:MULTISPECIES: DUF6325 family protein [unclassified Microbacterium]|uniref:DUF6325 family protein n=1 Tax=unclassified Microbacterium TaxID=2609290 RepID=UPI003017A182